MSYASEKLGSAIEGMVSSHESLKERLLGAFFTFHTLSEKDFPEELKPHWKSIFERITKDGAIIDEKGNVPFGSAENTINNMSKIDQSTLASDIMALYIQLEYVGK
ncbi:MAG: hypothetical protein H7195_11400 [Chryseobacterium sp.]|nr:hypothetical protein [Chryseobacterium sp.]